MRRDGPKITQKAMTELRRTYIDAGELVAKAVRESSLVDASSLDTQSLASIQSQLVKAAELIRDSAEDNSKKAVSAIVGRVGKIDETYFVSAIKSAGSTLSTVKIHNMVVAVNERVVENMTKRLWSDGYTFSTRIWDIGAGFQDDMKRVLSSGIAQGRDPVKIAADIEKYISGGKPVLMKRYGKLKAGTARFVRRIPQNVDYRAMRLVRTELYAALKEADVEAGKVNPGAEDLYDWIMNAGRADWDCDCPEYARNSPYAAAEVPTQPHPNCGCYIQPRLKDRREFVADLVKWTNGTSVEYLDRWKSEYYDNA